MAVESAVGAADSPLNVWGLAGDRPGLFFIGDMCLELSDGLELTVF